MKITPLVMTFALVLVVIAGVTVGAFNKIEGNMLYEDQAYRQLLSIAESKAERVKDFLDNKKTDAVFLSELEDVRDIFDEELSRDVGLMQSKIKSVSEKTRDEIEVYLLEHPDMTIEDLQNDENFESIAIQRIGDTGYTFVYDYDTMINKFHLKEEFRGINYTSLKDEPGREAWWEITKPTQYGKNELGGFLLWKEPDGNFKEKYRYTSIASVRTADGVGLAIGASTWADEYGGSVQLVSSLNREFGSFQNKKGYADLIFISSSGDVVWTAKRHNEIGTNLITGVYNDSLLANVFNKAKGDLGVGVSDSEIYGVSDELSIFITAPVMDVSERTGKEELRGIVALRLDNDKVEELIATDVGLGDAGEVYIINRDKHHITLLKFDGHNSSISENIDDDVFHEEVTSEGIENCFKDYDNYYFLLRGEDFDEVPKASRYIDYSGENRVLGAHSYILESGWCVIAEMGEDYYLSVVPNTNKSLMINLSFFAFLLLIISLVLDSFFDIRRSRK